MEPALLEWFPTKKLQHRRTTTFGVLRRWWWSYDISCIWLSVDFGRLQSFNVARASRRCTLDFINVTLGVRRPWWGRILQLWAYKSFVRHSFDLDWAFFYIPRDKGTCRVGFLPILLTCSLKVSLESMVMPKYLADGTKLSTLPCIKYVFVFKVIRRTSHLSGLNSICHMDSHFCNLSGVLSFDDCVIEFVD